MGMEATRQFGPRGMTCNPYWCRVGETDVRSCFGMAEFPRRINSRGRPTSNDGVPEDVARALDAAAEDVRHNRTVDIGDFLKSMETKLEAHRARKAAPKR